MRCIMIMVRVYYILMLDLCFTHSLKKKFMNQLTDMQ